MKNDKHNATLLIVDDEEHIIASLRSLFRRKPYTLHTFTSTLAALEALQYETPDIVLSDMRMPGMNGTEFLQKVQEACPTASRLMLSGYEDKTIVIEAVDRGIAQRFFMKPWDDDELLANIEEVLTMRRQIAEQHLSELLQNIRMLPIPPQMQNRLQRIIHRKHQSVSDLVAEVEQYPPLVIRIMRIANSVYYGARTPITNLFDAIIFIGSEFVESLLLSYEVTQQLRQSVPSETDRIVELLWRKSIDRATIGKTLAEQWKGYHDVHTAYLACLLLDIGFYVRAHSDPEAFTKLIRIADALSVSLIEAERKVYDIDHATIGAALLELWNFPPVIVETVREHHGICRKNPLFSIAQLSFLLQAGTRTIPHDPALDTLLTEWAEKLGVTTLLPKHPD